jgi:hypothetical protein
MSNIKSLLAEMPEEYQSLAYNKMLSHLNPQNKYLFNKAFHHKFPMARRPEKEPQKALPVAKRVNPVIEPLKDPSRSTPVKDRFKSFLNKFKRKPINQPKKPDYQI